ncbi:unnamed protein product [Cunninghamella blakesleeana]
MQIKNKNMTHYIVIPSSKSITSSLPTFHNHKSSSIIISRTTMVMILFIIMMIKSSMGQLVTNGCISLQGSKSCSGFQKYYLGATAVNNMLNINASSLNSIDDLDNELLNYTHSSLDYMSSLGCADTSSSSSYPYARYSLSRLCAGLIQDTQSSLPCNYNNNMQPPPLCQSTCLQWISSVTNITNSSSICPNQQSKNTALFQLDDSCENWSGYSGQPPQCISGVENEPNNCGFNDNDSEACNYCKTNPSDTCCQSVKCNKLSTGAIIGIVIGSLIAGGGIIGCILFFFCCKKKRITRETSFSFKTYIQPSTQSKTNNGVFDASEDHHHNGSHKVLIDNESQFQYYNHHGNNNSNNNNNRSPITPTFPTIQTSFPDNNNNNNIKEYHQRDHDFLDDNNNNSNDKNHRRGSSSASNPFGDSPFGDRFEVISLHSQTTKSNIPIKSTPLVTIDTTSTIATTNGIQHQQKNIGNVNMIKEEKEDHFEQQQIGEEDEPIYDEEFYQVVHPYPPQMVDELGLSVGDIVCLAMGFDDGWALGFNVNTGLKGVFPLVCVSPLPPNLLEQLYQNENNDQFSSKVLIEEENNISSSIQYTQPQPPPPLETIHLHNNNNNNNNSNNNNNNQQQSPMALHNIRKIREDLRRSLSLSSNYSFSSINTNTNNNNHSPSLKHLSRSHTSLSSSSSPPMTTSPSPTIAAVSSSTTPSTNIPKRTASMMRSKQKQEQTYHNDDYYELNSPTHHTPLVSSIPPPTSPSKIVLPTSPKTETFEMYNHRLSKLQQE